MKNLGRYIIISIMAAIGLYDFYIGQPIMGALFFIYIRLEWMQLSIDTLKEAVVRIEKLETTELSTIKLITDEQINGSANEL